MVKKDYLFIATAGKIFDPFALEMIRPDLVEMGILSKYR